MELAVNLKVRGPDPPASPSRDRRVSRLDMRLAAARIKDEKLTSSA
jgi:hypothetical protein